MKCIYDGFNNKKTATSIFNNNAKDNKKEHDMLQDCSNCKKEAKAELCSSCVTKKQKNTLANNVEMSQM